LADRIAALSNDELQVQVGIVELPQVAAWAVNSKNFCRA
jgi:hypothetical protein